MRLKPESTKTLKRMNLFFRVVFSHPAFLEWLAFSLQSSNIGVSISRF
jgi:hypothetical protein